MELRSDVIFKTRAKVKYPFDEMNIGDSLHFKLPVLRKRALVAFNAWRKRTGNKHLRLESHKVDESDPDGPGYRAWMVRDEPASTAPRNTAWD